MKLRQTICQHYYLRFLDQHLTGRVTLMHETAKVDLMLDKGSIRSARSNDMAHRLGEILLMRGKIKVGQYEQSVIRMLDEGVRQGDALIEMGAVSREDLRWGIARQTKEIIYSLFNWPRMEYRIRALEHLNLDADSMQLSTHEVIVRGLKRIDDWPRIRNELFPYKQIFSINQTMRLKEAKSIRIKADEEQVLSLINGSRTVGEVLEESSVSGYDTARLIYGFKWARIIRLNLGD